MDRGVALSALKECAQLVEAAELPADLRPEGFRALLERALGTSRAFHADSASTGGGHAPLDDVDAPGADERLERVARRLGVEMKTVSRVLDLDEDGLHLQAARSRLPEARKAAQQEVALVLSAGRQASGLDQEWTSLKLVRQACDDLGVLDGPNFSKAINALNGSGVRVRSGKELKINQIGYEAAAEIMRRVGGAEA